MRYFQLVILTILVAITFHTFAQTTSPTQELEVLLQRYTTYQADFTQITYDSNRRVIQKSRGRVILMRPARFRWETKTPTRQIIVSNGRKLWVYDVDLAQATQQEIATHTNVAPAALLTGNIAAITRQFYISKVRLASGVWYRLQPKKKGNLQSVLLLFEQGQLQKVRMTNYLEQTSIFNFSNVQLNKRLSITIFDFKPPTGVDVLTR